MNKVIAALVFSGFIVGCAGPHYSGRAIDPQPEPSTYEVVVVTDSETKPGFLDAITNWLNDNNYTYSVVPDHSQHDFDKLTLEYVGRWAWDLAIYLSEARVEGFHGGQRVGSVEYRAPNTLSGAKFGNAAERVNYMLEVLFGRLTSEEATQIVNASPERRERREEVYDFD